MPKKISPEELVEREAEILKSACQIIEEEGFSGLTMDKVVERVPYSKGSIYKLFNSVEEILLAITNKGSVVLLEFMQRARDYKGNSRERNLARAFAYHLYGQLYPTHFFCELQAIGPLVREKASQKRLAHGLGLLNEFKALAKGFVEDAIDSGELASQEGYSSSRIANSSWSAEFGVTSYALAASDNQTNIGAETRDQLERDIFMLVNTYMDGLGWQPLSGSVNYENVWEDIKSTLFPKEIEQLAR